MTDSFYDRELARLRRGIAYGLLLVVIPWAIVIWWVAS